MTGSFRFRSTYSGVAIDPKNWVKYLKARSEVVPHTVIICFQPFAMRELSGQRQIVSFRLGTRRAYSFREAKKRWAAIEPLGIGAPAAVITIEEMMALGVKRFITIGGAGSLQPELDVGDIVLCRGAYRDEGTSSHYLAESSPELLMNDNLSLVDEFFEALTVHRRDIRTGLAWTTDAPFRETWAKITSYQKKGILAVDMEASALMAAARFRNCSILCSFVISDRIGHHQWEPGFRDKKVAKQLVGLLDQACQFANRREGS